MALPIGRVESAIAENSCLFGPVPQLLQGIEVSDYLVDLVAAQLHGRHKAAWLDVVRILNPEIEFRRGIVGCSRSKRVTAIKVGKIRAEFPVGGGAANHMAAEARLGLKDLPAFGHV